MTTLTLILLKCENFIFNIRESVQFSHSVMSDSLQPHGLQHTRPPRPSPTPGVDPNSCPLSRWCHPTISSSVLRLLLLPSTASVQGTHKSLLQHHSSKASVLQCSAFFTAYFRVNRCQLSHPYMTTGETISLDYPDLCWQRSVSAF